MTRVAVAVIGHNIVMDYGTPEAAQAALEQMERAASQPPSGDALLSAAMLVNGGWHSVVEGDNVRMRYASDLPARLNTLREALAQPPSGDAPDLRELVTELANELHGYGPVHDHHDPSDTTGWNVKGIETCGYPLCVAALAASAPSSPATPAPLDRTPEIICDCPCHLGNEVKHTPAPLDVEPMKPHEPGDPHVYEARCLICGEQGTVRVTLEPQLARAYANQEGGDCEHGIPRNECKLAEHDR